MKSRACRNVAQRRLLLTGEAGNFHFLKVESMRQVHIPTWKPASTLDEWVDKPARPISLRQLKVFGRYLTKSRLISSAKYVQTELPTRLAHRIRDMQTLPYIVVTNPHISQVYELYYKAFESIRRIGEIKSLEDNRRLCQTINATLTEHLTVIPNLAMGILECRDLMRPEQLDHFMNVVLRSRISRRVIAQQHLALSEDFLTGKMNPSLDGKALGDTVGEVFLKCNADSVIKRCLTTISKLCTATYGSSVKLPSIQIKGHLAVTFPYILSHLEYIVGELLRNSIQATVEKHKFAADLPPIEITICEAPLYIMIRFSDRGGGIDPSILPYIWSFSTGPRSSQRLQNLSQVPKMAATLQELHVTSSEVENISVPDHFSDQVSRSSFKHTNTDEGYQDIAGLRRLSERPPNLKLGMGLPLSRIYAEYWAGSLEFQSMEGYGVDILLGISKLGNQNEQVTARAIIDAV